jgi:hypothetical protein
MKERNDKIINMASAMIGQIAFLEMQAHTQAESVILGVCKSYALDIMVEAGFTSDEMDMLKNFTVKINDAEPVKVI